MVGGGGSDALCHISTPTGHVYLPQQHIRLYRQPGQMLMNRSFAHLSDTLSHSQAAHANNAITPLSYTYLSVHWSH